jgi:hypothetical protein
MMPWGDDRYNVVTPRRWTYRETWRMSREAVVTSDPERQDGEQMNRTTFSTVTEVTGRVGDLG